MTIPNTSWVTQDTALLAQLVAGTMTEAACASARAELADQWNGGSLSNVQLYQRFVTFSETATGFWTTPATGGPNGDGTITIQNSQGAFIVIPGYRRLVELIAKGDTGAAAASAFGFFLENQVGSSERLRYVADGPQTFTKFKATAITPPAAAVTIQLLHNGAAAGSATFAAGQARAIAVLTGGLLSLAEDDTVDFLTPAAADASFAGVTLIIGN